MRFNKKWAFLIVAPIIAATASGAVLYRAPAEPDPSGLRLVADLSDKRLKMFEADTLVWQYPISDGTGGYPTPTGNFSVRHLVWNPRWTPPPNSEWAKKYTAKGPGEKGNPMRVVKIFFREPDYYIHGTSEISKLGNAASHGCIRMDPEHVAEVARYIMEHGGQPRDENWFQRILHFRSVEKSIYLKRPVPLVVKR
jgi:lipoprotein-anchoring transpeptidase ErfK/SrfK